MRRRAAAGSRSCGASRAIASQSSIRRSRSSRTRPSPSDDLIRRGRRLLRHRAGEHRAAWSSPSASAPRACPARSPLRLADALREAGVELVPTNGFFDDRRRRKSRARSSRASAARRVPGRRAWPRSQSCSRGRSRAKAGASSTASRSPASCFAQLRSRPSTAAACRGDDLIVARRPAGGRRPRHRFGPGRERRHLVCDLFPRDIESGCFAGHDADVRGRNARSRRSRHGTSRRGRRSSSRAGSIRPGANGVTLSRRRLRLLRGASATRRGSRSRRAPCCARASTTPRPRRRARGPRGTVAREGGSRARTSAT